MSLRTRLMPEGDVMTTITERAVATDLLRIADLTPAQCEQVLDLAAWMKAKPYTWVNALRGHSLACFFEKPSTRTRVSFAAAAYRLGMLPIMLRPDELQLGRGEPIADTARVLSSYADAIVIRTFAQHTLEEMAAAASAPIINALSNEHHPCQALADLLTLREHFGRLAGLRLAYLGDGNNVAHSLMEAGALAGMHVVVATPEGERPHRDVEVLARRIAAEQGGNITLVTDPRAAVVGADAVYTDVWVSMGEEAEQARRLRDLAPYQVNVELMALAQPHAVFMHCLPAHRGQEVTAEVIDGPASAVWKQAANRLPTEQAVVYLLITNEWN
jgi:ornithine carbamoyltransferase